MIAFSDFDADPRDLTEYNIDAYPLQDTIHRVLEGTADANWTPTGLTRNDYLDLVERIAGMAADWVDDEGAVIDPVINQEWGQTTPRFCASAATLLHFGRAEELLPVVCRSMDNACRRLPETDPGVGSPDFWMRDLTWAMACLKDVVSKDQYEAWRADLSRVDAETVNKYVDPTRQELSTFHNWAVYGASGESIRESLGIGVSHDGLWGHEFFEIYMAEQFHRFTPEGMYRDPGDPMTYDLTTRLQFSIALAFGYDGKHRAALEEIQRRGSLTSLLYCSPDGMVPFGGRSSHFHFQEAICAATFEWEARRYTEQNPQLAAAFKRQARLSAAAVRPWLMMDPPRHIKNRFAPETRHGCDTYGHYSVYSLLAATFFGVAAVFADDDIPEEPAPSELGGYAVTLQPSFHKVFMSCGGNYAEIDPAAQQIQDATGLGRVLLAGKPFGILPTMGCSQDPHYVCSDDGVESQALACGPQWELDGKVQRLAALGVDELTWNCEVHEESQERVSLTSTTNVKDGPTVTEVYTLNADGLVIECRVTQGGDAIDFDYLLPVLSSDGEGGVQADGIDSDTVTLSYRGDSAEVRSSEIWVESKAWGTNRLGCFGALKAHSIGDVLRITFCS